MAYGIQRITVDAPLRLQATSTKDNSSIAEPLGESRAVVALILNS